MLIVITRGISIRRRSRNLTPPNGKTADANPGHTGSYRQFLTHSPRSPPTTKSLHDSHRKKFIPHLSEKMSKPEGYPFIGEPTGLKVIIVGAGLGGLACAIECRRKGHQVIVFENAPEIRRIGDTLVTPHPCPSISLTPSYHSPVLVLAYFQENRSECGQTHLPLGNPRPHRPIVRSHGSFQDFPQRR